MENLHLKNLIQKPHPSIILKKLKNIEHAHKNTIKKTDLNENKINHYIKYVTQKYNKVTSKNINKSTLNINEEHTIEYGFQIYDLLINILKDYCEKDFILNY